jgi:hypothetical protein
VNNLQRLAEKVLRRTTRKVSCLPTLGEETGNLSGRHGNCDGNLTTKTYQETLTASAFALETGQETQGKPVLNSRETFTLQNRNLKFPKSKGTVGLLEDFFKKTEFLGLNLLSHDKRWLMTICIAEPLVVLEELLYRYIEHWIHAMDLQPQEHRKQNAGRFKANEFIREALSMKSRAKYECKDSKDRK